MTVTHVQTDQASVQTIRLLAIDMVAKANSGHPGAPMGMAPIAHILFTRHLVANPKDHKWINRDRVVLSNGHASALLYAMLHLSGYNLSINDLKGFRQLGSKTPGHPESFKTDGVEVTTGPLGQGFANAVGLAIAQENLAATFNKTAHTLFNNKTYVFCGDGCLQEGVAAEAASMAGHLRLSNLIVMYDDNSITIDGSTDNSFTENVDQRFQSYGWKVLTVENADEDLEAINKALSNAKESSAPTLIRFKTTIGYGSKVQGTHGVHGSPLKRDDIEEIKARFGFDQSKSFQVPAEVYEQYRSTVLARGTDANAKWLQTLKEYQEEYPDSHSELSRRVLGKLPKNWASHLPVFKPDDEAVGGRKYSEIVLNSLASIMPELLGGSADLTSSNYTRVKQAVDFQPPETGLGSYSGNYLRYGVREHAMGAIMNGLSAYGMFLPFAGTFLNFVSYAAGSVRLSALSGHQVLWVATHDSIGLGEDGPTHQPVETAAWLRAMPNLHLWRPADGNETSAAYLVAIEAKSTPSVLCLSRQALPQLPNSTIEAAAKGAYVVRPYDSCDVTLVATGSEVTIALAASELLETEGLKARVVSLPCWEVFKTQSKEYQSAVFPGGHPVLSVEAYSAFGWSAFSDEHVGLEGWGDSAPPAVLYEHFGITPKHVAARAANLVQRSK